jgi:outer membrane protein OmpA-like peptidoglycan-associated protein
LTAICFISPVYAQKEKTKKDKKVKDPDLILSMDFESTIDDEKPSEIGSIELLQNKVKSPTEIPADLFSLKGSGDAGVPKNLMGIEDPIKDEGGENYAGFCAYKPGKAAKERSYITIPLYKDGELQTLKENLLYCIEFSVSLSESSKFAVNNLAAYLSKGVPSPDKTPGYLSGEKSKIVKAQGNKVYTGFYGWEKVCNLYKTTVKGEDHITIGNFDINEQTQFIQLKKPKDSEVDQIPQAYYYVDNVIIRRVDKPEDCKCYNANPQKVEENYSTLIFTNNPEITDKMSLADKIGVYDVYFRFGKSSFTDNAKEMMKYVVEQMKANPKLRIEVQGNRDATEGKAAESNPEYEDMDRKRVNAVVEYLIAQGIAPERLEKAYNGADVPNPKIDSENDDQEVQDAKNRRVYFKVLK